MKQPNYSFHFGQGISKAPKPIERKGKSKGRVTKGYDLRVKKDK